MERAVFISRRRADHLAERIAAKMDCRASVFPRRERGATTGYHITVFLGGKVIPITENML